MAHALVDRQSSSDYSAVDRRCPSQYSATDRRSSSEYSATDRRNSTHRSMTAQLPGPAPQPQGLSVEHRHTFLRL